MPGALLTDLYELKMAASYLRHDMAGEATFSLFIRDLPPSRGYLVAAGIETCCSWLEQFSFEPDDLAYLGALGFDEPTLEAFSGVRFTGEVFAIPEGRIVFANEPLIEITAPIVEAQLVETYLLNQISLQTMLATKAARCRVEAAGEIELVEFGFRRAQGIEAGLQASRLAALVGFSATSNVEAARRFGLAAAGTMAHSYIEAFEDEAEAFATFAADFPEQTTLLVDTYDTLAGVALAIDVIRRQGIEDHSGIRLDSGDLVELARSSRQLLDAAGLDGVRIFASGGLDEYEIAKFVAARAPIDAAGVGTRLVVSEDAPYLDSVYKLVSYDNRPVIKLSEGKGTLPGPKQVFRAKGLRDSIGCRNEEAPGGSSRLLERFMSGGRRVTGPARLEECRIRFESDLHDLPDQALDLSHPVAPVATITPMLSYLTDDVLRKASG